MRSLRGKTALSVGALLLWAGCGSDQLPTYPVTGQVVYPDGAPLRGGGRVWFRCNSVVPAITAKGRFGEDGRFTLTTFHQGDGAVAGDYQVVVLPDIPDDKGTMTQAEYERATNPIDQRFRVYETSRLEFTVSADGTPKELRLEVHRPRRP